MLNRLIDGEILLKPLEAHDADRLFALTDANRAYLRRWLPWVDSTKSVEDTQSFIQTCVAQLGQKSAMHLAVRYRDEMAGVFGFHHLDRANRSTSVGYWLGEQFQGRGIMTRTCREAVSFAFKEVELNRVEIRCAVQNARSRAIPERMQFVNEGIVRDGEWLYDHHVDLVIYGMLAREWPAA